MNNGDRVAGRNSGASSPVCESLYNTSRSRSLEAQHSLDEEEDEDGADGDRNPDAAASKLVIGIAAQSRGVAKRSSSSSSSGGGGGGGGGGGNDTKRPKTVVA